MTVAVFVVVFAIFRHFVDSRQWSMLGFDGRCFLIRMVVVASGSVMENESQQPWMVADGAKVFFFFFFF